MNQAIHKLVLISSSSVIPANSPCRSAQQETPHEEPQCDDSCFARPRPNRPLEKKAVKFEEQVRVYPIVHLNEYSDEELHNVWYDRKELSLAKAECLETVRMIVQKQPLDPNTQCSRGLEYRTPEGLERRQRNKFYAMDAVLNEQDAQWQNNENDAEFLSDVYQEYSVPCQSMAHRIALRDERYVQSLCDEKKVEPLMKPLVMVARGGQTRMHLPQHHKLYDDGDRRFAATSASAAA